MRVAVVVIAMWVSAFRPAPQHLAERGDHAAQLDLAKAVVDAGLTTAPEMVAVPATFALALPHRSCASVATVATCRAIADTNVSSHFARGPPV